MLGLYRDNGKENGNYYSILGLYRDNGKENGNYYLGFRFRVLKFRCSASIVASGASIVARAGNLRTMWYPWIHIQDNRV